MTDQDIGAAAAGTAADGWRLLADGLQVWYDAPTHAAGAALAARVLAGPGAGDGAPEIDVRARGVRVRIPGPAAAAGTGRARAIAAAVTDAARELGLTADSAELQLVSVAIDSPDPTVIVPFWRSVLGYRYRGEALDDPLRRDPSLAFATTDRRLPLRQRLHVDVCRPVELAGWAAAALDAGGHDVRLQEGYRALADADGNEVDVVPGGPLDDDPAVADWRVLFGAMAFYRTAAPEQAAALMEAAARLADASGQALLIDRRPDGVTLDTGKDQWEDAGFVTLAAGIQTAARELSLVADPTRLSFVQVGIDVADVEAARAFWQVALGYAEDPRPFVTDLYDPRRLGPPVFFQSLHIHDRARREQPARARLRLCVPADRLRARLDAIGAAGGRVLRQEPSGSALVADSEGNELELTAAD